MGQEQCGNSAMRRMPVTSSPSGDSRRYSSSPGSDWMNARLRTRFPLTAASRAALAT